MSKKRIITLVTIVAAIVGIIYTGSLFNLIDMIIVRPIVNILFFIYNIIGDFGCAIILFTIIVKLAMLPLTKKQLRQTRLTRKIQPELAEIKKNAKGNKQLESMQTMELYKKYKINPLSSLLMLLIQLPIFIALFSAIRVIATPIPTDNLSNRAYSFVAYEGSIIKDIENKQQTYLEDVQNNVYDYHPQLFGVVNLDTKASSVFGDFSWSALFMFICSVAAAFLQYWNTRQQMATNKKGKKKFRDLLQDAKDGKDIDQSAVTDLSAGQMSYMMPLMMFLVMFNLNGALAFYYFLNNIISVVQQKIILKNIDKNMNDISADTSFKEFKKIREAEIIENKKTGTKITRISAKDNKKKRR